MRIVFLVLAAGLIAAAIPASPIAAADAQGANQAAPKCNLTLYASLDLTMQPNGLITVPVKVNGREVAFAVGFQSLSQFNRVFKILSGKSPTQYRAAHLPRRHRH